MSIQYHKENITQQPKTIQSNLYETKLKKHVLDLYEENLLIDRLRKLPSQDFSFHTDPTGKDKESIHRWWEQTGNIPKQLMLKLRKLQTNFLKQEQQIKNTSKNNNLNKNKNNQQQQKKLNEMMSRLQLQINSNNIVPLGQRSTHENVPKALHSKLTQLYNQYITHQRNNQIKRQQLQAKQKYLQQQNDNLKQLEKELKIKQKYLEELRFMKIHEQQQRKQMNEKIELYFDYGNNQNRQQ